MCIGTPLQVVAVEGHQAWCQADGQRELLDMRLVGPLPIGSWVLGFMGAARQVLDPVQADRAREARRALAAVLDGACDVDDCFADLIGRTPSLPPHLQPQAAAAGPTALPSPALAPHATP